MHRTAGVWRAVALCTLCASGSSAAAGNEATLELVVGQPDELALQELHLVVDGEERPIALPAGPEVPSPVYTGPIAPGVHELTLQATYRGRSPIFTYLEGYRFRMRGRGKVEVLAGEVVHVQSRVLSRKGLTVQWHEQPYLSLTVVNSRSVRQIDEPPGPAEAAAEAAPNAAAPSPEPQPAAAAVAASPRAVPAAELRPAATPEAAAPRATPPAEPEPPAAATPASRAAPAAASPPPAAPAAEAASCALEAVHFEFARSELGESARAALDRFAACLGGTNAAFVLEGHCDVRGSEDYNRRLGADRARSAARYLRERGVAAGRISVRSYGKSRPLCTADGPECDARNRRVEASLRE